MSWSFLEKKKKKHKKHIAWIGGPHVNYRREEEGLGGDVEVWELCGNENKETKRHSEWTIYTTNTDSSFDLCLGFFTVGEFIHKGRHGPEESRLRKEERENGRMLSPNGSVQVGAYAARPDHHPHRVRSPHRLLSRRPRPPPIQRRTFSLSLSAILTFQFSIMSFLLVWIGLGWG